MDNTSTSLLSNNMDQSSLIATLTAAGVLTATAAWSYLAQPNKYHPGPTPLPVFGNLHQIPRELPWVTYKEWSKTYGPCVHLEIVGKHILILNDAKDAEELLTKRALNTAERPHLVMAGDLVGFGRGLALMPYDQDAKETRKLIHLTVGAKGLSAHYNLLESETIRFLRGLRESPQDFIDHLSYSAGAIILKIAYGYDVLPKEDPLVALAADALDKFSRTTLLGEFPVDIFPILQYVPSWFPGVQFKKLAEEWRPIGKDLFNKPFDFVKDQIRQGNTTDSFASRHLEALSEWNDDVIGSRAEIIKSTATSLYAGAADTTVSAMRSFFLAMTIYQDIQSKAQQEIDTVVGRGRLPTLADRPNLPYCESLVKEVLRWGVVGPLGIPHVTKADETYQDRLIPKGTVIVANIWAMLHDETQYPDPFIFNPDRHLGESAQPDPTRFVFGWGTRACPGSRMATASMFLSVTNTLSLFNILRVRDQRGQEIIPEAEFVTGTISHPKPFQCEIVPRQDAKLNLLDE